VELGTKIQCHLNKAAKKFDLHKGLMKKKDRNEQEFQEGVTTTSY
jgi:hypothetical protein